MESSRLLDIIRQGENERVEFKPTTILKQKSDLCAGLVALANRHGGVLLLGVNDDRSLEGAKIVGDDLVTQVSNLAKDKCSPPVSFDFEVHNLEGGDVLVLEVHRRTSIPSAVIERRGAEIRDRTYYVRGANGKKLVEDSELEWMFRNKGEPNFQSLFRISIPYDRKTLEPAITEMPRFFVELVPFLQLSSEDLNYLTSDEHRRASSFFLEILPYAVLRHFSWVFRNSWLVRVIRRKGEIQIQTEKVPSKEEVDVLKVPQPEGSAIFKELKARPWDAFRTFPGLISMPKGTSVTIIAGPNLNSPPELILSKQGAFKFTFNFQFRGWNEGMPWGDPRRVQRMLSFKLYNPDANLATVTADCMFTADFSFPDSPDPDFNEHHRYARLIESLLKNDWDFDTHLKSLPDIHLYLLENKIDDLLEAVRSLSEKRETNSSK